MNNQQVPKQMKLRAAELSFHVLDSSSGEPTLLFLQYSGGLARTWNAVTERLSVDFRCIAYDLEKLILVAPAAPTPRDIPDFAKEAQLHAYDNRKNALRTIEFLTAQPPAEEVREQILSDNFAFTAQAKLAWPTVIAYEDISADVGKIAAPTLVLAGDQDRQDPV